jgi:hypothetical protein
LNSIDGFNPTFYFCFMKLLFILVLFFSIPNGLFAQSSFSINIINEEEQGVTGQVELRKGNYWFYYFREGFTLQPKDMKGYIFRINDLGDTSSIALNSSDTIRFLFGISRISENEFIAVGNQMDPPFSSTKMLVLKLDSNLNILSKKSYQLSGYGRLSSLNILKKSNTLLYLTGSIYIGNDLVLTKPYLIKINSSGDTLSTKYLDGTSMAGFTNSVFSQDSTQIWMFGAGYGSIISTCRLATDTNFQIKTITALGANSNGPVSFPLVGKTYNNDSVLILGTYLMALQHPQNNDLGITKTDTALQSAPIHYFGKIDTIDYAADFSGLDFINYDSIFYAGTHNIIPFYYSNGVSWIMTGMLDHNLNSRYENYYGGDAYYRTALVTATMDGGSLITAIRHAPVSYHQDIWILKLTPDGVLTNVNSLKTQEYKRVLIYPNPGEDHFFARTGLKNATLRLFDLNSKAIGSYQLKQGVTSIKCSTLVKGIYLYEILINNQIIEAGKWIKK